MNKLFKNKIHEKILALFLVAAVGTGSLFIAPSIALKAESAETETSSAAADANTADTVETPGQKSENKQAVSNPAAKNSGSFSFGKFESDTQSIPVGETKTVTFKAKLTGGTNSAGFNIAVVDSSNNSIGYMRDNGTNGDSSAGDGTYTLKVSLSSDKEKSVSYCASANGVTSPSVTINYYTPTSEDKWNSMHAAENTIHNYMSSDGYKAKSEDEKTSAVKDMLNKMADEGKIKHDTIYYDETQKQYYFEYATSTPGIIKLTKFNDKLNAAGGGAQTAQNVPEQTAQLNAQSGEAVGGSSCKALVLNGFEDSAYRRDFYNNLKTDWNSIGISTTVDVDVTVDDMKTLASYDVVVFAMHGSDYSETWENRHPVLCINQTPTTYTDQKYDYELNVRHSVVKAYYTDGTTGYWVLPLFFTDTYSGSGLDGVFIYSETCMFYGCECQSSSIDYSMANAIYSCSAEAVVGYRNSVGANYSRDMMRFVVESIYYGAPLTTAVTRAKGIYGNTDDWEDVSDDKYESYPVITPSNSKFILRNETISLNSSKTVNILTGGVYKYFKIVPTANTTVTFYSTGSSDTYGYVYDANLNELATNDDGGDEHNFKISYNLQSGTTYYLACKHYDSASTGSFTVTLSGQAQQKSITGCTITLGKTSYLFDNTAKTPTVTVKDGSTTLSLGTDYTVTYQNNTAVGTAKAIINGINKYNGTVTKTFTISYDTISLNTAKTVSITKAGTMKYMKFVPTSDMTAEFYSAGSDDTFGYLYNSSLTQLASDDDSGSDHNFKITYSLKANTTYIFACKFYSTTKTGNITVMLSTSKKSITGCTISLSKTSYLFDNTAKTPTVTVKDGSTTLSLDTDYTVTYQSNTAVGTGKVIVTGINNYKDSVTKTFTISYDTISLNTAKTVSITKAGTMKYMKFVPTSDMTAEFYSAGSDDTFGYLYNSSLTQLASDDDSGSDHNFKITYSLKANTTYIFACKFYGASKTGNISVKLVESKKSINNCTISLSKTSYLFDKTAKTPTVTVKDGSTTLTKNTDYTLTYQNNVNVGTGKVIVTGTGKYKDSVTKTFTISYDTISLNTAKTVSITKAGTMKYMKFVPTANMTIEFYSTGSGDTCGYLYNSSLSQLTSNDNGGTDNNFKITYDLTANTTYIFACKFKSSTATGNISVKLVEAKRSVKNCTVTLSKTSYLFDNTAKTPTVTVKDGSKTLTKNTDYTIKYENNTNVGTAKVTVTGTGKYKDSVTKTFTISYDTISLSTAKTVSITKAGTMKYMKFVPTANMTVEFCSTGSTDTVGYLYNSSLSLITSNDNGGADNNFKITYNLTAKTTYIFACKFKSSTATGNISVKLAESQRSVKNCTVTLSKTSYLFDKTAKTPTIIVKDGSTTLSANKDYTLKYENNINVGTAKVTVTGKDKYKDSVTKTYTISYDTIKLSTAKTVSITVAGTMKYMKFVPTANMTVEFYSTGSGDTYGYLYNSSLSQLASNNDGGDNKNFKINYNLTANTTYIFACKFSSSTATGNISVNLVESKKSVKNCTVTLSKTSYLYDNTAKTPTVTVKDGSKTLTKGTDYTIKYENNVNTGTGKVTVTGTGDYKDSVTKTFKIEYDTISLNTAKTVSVTKGGTMKYVKFVPTANMTVEFYSTGSEDTYAVLYDANMNVITHDDDGGDNRNFKITQTLKANTTYIFACKFYSTSVTGNISLMLKKSA